MRVKEGISYSAADDHPTIGPAFRKAVSLGDKADKTSQQAHEIRLDHARGTILPEIVKNTGGGTQKLRGHIDKDIPEESRAKIKKAMDFLSTLVGEKVVTESIRFSAVPPEKLKDGKGHRSYCKGDRAHVYLAPAASVATVVHEIGHAIDHMIAGKIGRKSKAFAAAATFGEKVVHMGKGYQIDEVGSKDGFKESYTGKNYYRDDSSEVLSMGVQHLYENANHFAENHRDHFNFTIAALRALI